MSPIKYTFLSIALVLTTVVSFTPSAAAQGTVVITIDEARLLRDSRAGKDLAAKLKSIESQMKSELEPTRASLETEGKSLQTQLQGKTQEAVAADAALVTTLQNYQNKANSFAQRRAVTSQELALTERKALVDFNKALEPVLLEVVQERNAGIVLSRNQVAYATEAVDVTQTIITKLDARTPTINVVRQRAPAQPTQ